MQASDETKLKILLVDDDRTVRETVATILERLGHEVIQGTNGREGLELYASSRVDIVISDIMMPDIDGLEFLRALNEQGEDVELIFITGHGDLKTAVHALREGAFDFFTNARPLRRARRRARTHPSLSSAATREGSHSGAPRIARARRRCQGW